MTDSLVQYFKNNPLLEIDIGEFNYVSNLGQGGNASVLKFKRDDHEFAIKFIPHNEEKKYIDSEMNFSVQHRFRRIRILQTHTISIPKH